MTKQLKLTDLDKNNIVGIAIVALAIMQVAAMYFGVNGTFRTMIVGIIAGLAGWRIPSGK